MVSKVSGGEFSDIGAGICYDSPNERLTLAAYNDPVGSKQLPFPLT